MGSHATYLFPQRFVGPKPHPVQKPNASTTLLERASWLSENAPHLQDCCGIDCIQSAVELLPPTCAPSSWRTRDNLNPTIYQMAELRVHVSSTVSTGRHVVFIGAESSSALLQEPLQVCNQDAATRSKCTSLREMLDAGRSTACLL